MLPRTVIAWEIKEAQMRADAEKKALEEHMGSWIPFHSGQLSAQCWLYALEIESQDAARPRQDRQLVAEALREFAPELVDNIAYEDIEHWLDKRAGVREG